MQFFAHVPAWTDSATRVAVGSSLSGAREVLPWLKAAGKLLRHVQSGLRLLRRKGRLCPAAELVMFPLIMFGVQ